MKKMFFNPESRSLAAPCTNKNQGSALAKKQSILHISFDSQKSLGQSPFRRVVSLGSRVGLATHQAPSVALHQRSPEAVDCKTVIDL